MVQDPFHKKENVLKIGFTLKPQVEQRVSELFDTSSPTKFLVLYKVRVIDPRALEQKVHAKLCTSRIAENREFFKISTAAAVAAIRAIIDEAPNKFRAEDEYCSTDTRSLLDAKPKESWVLLKCPSCDTGVHLTWDDLKGYDYYYSDDPKFQGYLAKSPSTILGAGGSYPIEDWQKNLPSVRRITEDLNAPKKLEYDFLEQYLESDDDEEKQIIEESFSEDALNGRFGDWHQVSLISTNTAAEKFHQGDPAYEKYYQALKENKLANAVYRNPAGFRNVFMGLRDDGWFYFELKIHEFLDLLKTYSPHINDKITTLKNLKSDAFWPRHFLKFDNQNSSWELRKDTIQCRSNSNLIELEFPSIGWICIAAKNDFDNEKLTFIDLLKKLTGKHPADWTDSIWNIGSINGVDYFLDHFFVRGGFDLQECLKNSENNFTKIEPGSWITGFHLASSKDDRTRQFYRTSPAMHIYLPLREMWDFKLEAIREIALRIKFADCWGDDADLQLKQIAKTENEYQARTPLHLLVG